MFNNNINFNTGKVAAQSNNIYAGEALVTPIMFNPSAEDIRRIKGIPDTVEMKEPVYTRDIDNQTYTRVALLCKFDPKDTNAKLDADNKFVEYSFLIFDEFVQGKAKGSNPGKYQVMDKFLNTGWMYIKDDQTIEEAFAEAVTMKNKPIEDGGYKEKDPLFRMDPASTRKVKIGEVALHELIFTMMDISHNNTLFKEVGMEFSLQPFFENKLEDVNKFISENESFKVDGVQKKFYLMLGGNEYNGKLTQTCYMPRTEKKIGSQAIARESSSLSTHDGVKFHMPRETWKFIVDKEYPWTRVHKGPGLCVVTMDDVASNETTIDNGFGNTGFDSGFQMPQNPVGGFDLPVDDGLPF